MKKIMMLAATATITVAGCQKVVTEEGCTVFIGPELQHITEACVAAYHAEKARLEGREVTTCRTVGNTTTCVTE